MALLLLTACATNDTAERQLWEDSQSFGADNLTPITLTASDAARAETVTTRAETEIQTALFDADEVLQAYVWHVGDEVNNSFEPLLTTREASGGVNPLIANQRIYWPADITKTVSLYALYPSVVTKSTTDFTVSGDQRDDDSYKASDLMYGARADVPYSDDPLNIPFAHKMAKLIVNATSDGSVSGVDVTGITVKSVKRKIGFNAVTGALGGDATLGDEGNIMMSNNGACLLPPQTIAADHGLIEVAVSIGGTAATATFKAASAMTLQEGYQYTLNLEIGSQSLAQTAKITDWSSVSPYHTIAPVELGSITMDAIDAVTYNGLEQTPAVIVRDAASKTALTLDTDYTLDYYANTNAGTALVVATGKSGTDYVGQVAVQEFTINPAPLTVTADDKSKTYGDDNPALTYTTSGWVNGESESTITGWNAPTLSTTAEKLSSVTSSGYPITATNATASNYTISYTEGTLTINKFTITDWSISPTSKTIDEGDSFTITVDYGTGVTGGTDPATDHGDLNLTATGTNIVELTSASGTVKGKNAGSATVTAAIDDGTNYTFSGSKTCEVTVNSGKYVDLGLSVKWAKTNVGATKESEYGMYFAWGETTTKSVYNKTSYTYSANPTTLPADRDAAKQSSDYSDGRMPTAAEFNELLNNTNRTWTSVNGVNGYKFTSKTDTSKSIFLPAAGQRRDTATNYQGVFGCYWSSSLYTSYTDNAYGLYFVSGTAYVSGIEVDGYRYVGYTVRAVQKK